MLLLAVVGTIGCDRVTKHAASINLADSPTRSYLGDTVRIGYVENPGGFLGLGAGWAPRVRTAVFTVATGVLLLIVTVVAVRRRLRGWQALGLAICIAGGVSNWVDRITQGTVVDFLNDAGAEVLAEAENRFPGLVDLVPRAPREAES